ncbi:LytTR family DNA-binding domain-containing protein [Glaciecola sp. KUL10]|uniref:LytR/AlgR family response regulator transcription factor n=1 Tax=Glaciecola sp. (strain KUL10) TaxID=2161813 RepID=UPI000D787018|nr:LytTR family DNA-binding domain-containing protein [Glaciecola sp. KUL10]GBL05908.1 hypothetical protein KUL10_32410 [Glaciecola sp. KUL10]
MKILIVDNEQLAMKNLLSLVQEYYPNCEVITSDSPSKAVDMFFSEHPDVIFLDIVMPEINGIELAKIFSGKSVIVFVTEHAGFAVDAFNLGATDYMLKPLKKSRFSDSVTKINNRLGHGQSGKELSSIKRALYSINQHINKATNAIIPIKEVGKIRIISIEDIEYLSGSGNYVEIFLKNGQMVLHRESMSKMEEKLNEQDFIRIHRSSIVRFSAISELMTSKRGDYTVRLKNGAELSVSRLCKAEVLSYFR